MAGRRADRIAVFSIGESVAWCTRYGSGSGTVHAITLEHGAYLYTIKVHRIGRVTFTTRWESDLFIS